jgi:hypothetical protein
LQREQFRFPEMKQKLNGSSARLITHHLAERRRGEVLAQLTLNDTKQLTNQAAIPVA